VIPVRDAAERLGVSVQQTHRLLQSGQLRGRRSGSQWLVAPESIRQLELVRPGRGRPRSALESWKLLLASEPQSIEDLAQLAARSRKRGTLHECRALPYRLDELAASPDVVLSGARGALHQGAHIGADAHVHIYVKSHAWDHLARRYRLVDDSAEANLFARAVSAEAWPFAPGQEAAPLVVCAVDSYASGDLRSAHEALEAMQRDE
jgi:excisionase family DNA binding protein